MNEGLRVEPTVISLEETSEEFQQEVHLKRRTEKGLECLLAVTVEHVPQRKTSIPFYTAYFVSDNGNLFTVIRGSVNSEGDFNSQVESMFRDELEFFSRLASSPVRTDASTVARALGK